LYAPGGDRVGQCGVVAFVLVGAGLAEVGHGLVECGRPAEVGGDRDPVPGAGVGAGSMRRLAAHANQAGLIAVGEPAIEKGLDKALTQAAKVVKRTVDATTDEITSELQEALKS
jgi:hypothetical protein